MPQHLLEGEELVIRVHRHWMLVARSLLAPAALLAVVVFGLDLLLGRSLPGDVKAVATLLAMAVAGLWLIVAWFQWASESFTLTDQRVLLDKGILSRSSKVIPLDRIQDVATVQTLLGRLLHYGRVEIDAAGAAGAEVLDDIPRPNVFRDQVFLQSERLRRSAAALR
jgi:uncharacterized membrane protein YdbT with pleckstrin-like domain